MFKNIFKRKKVKLFTDIEKEFIHNEDYEINEYRNLTISQDKCIQQFIGYLKDDNTLNIKFEGFIKHKQKMHVTGIITSFEIIQGSPVFTNYICINLNKREMKNIIDYLYNELYKIGNVYNESFAIAYK